MITTGLELALAPISKLFLPPRHLSSCFFAGILRDTRGADLSDIDRLNHFPASPLVTVTLVMDGELKIVPQGQYWRFAKDIAPLPKLSVTPPQDGPVSSWSAGKIRAISLGIYHDAWLTMGGAADYTSIPIEITEALGNFAVLEDNDVAWTALCARLSSFWQDKREASLPVITGISDWVRSIIARTALSGSGKSLRSMQRQIKRTTGQTRQDLDFYSTFENLHRISLQNADGSAADIAIDAGYSDQSHMGRAVRRATGFSPSQLNQAIETEEAFWCYRLLGERF